MSYQLWKLEGGKPVFVGAVERPEELDPMVRKLPKGTTVAKARDGLVNASNGTEAQLKLFRAAVAEGWRRAGGAPPPPLPVPTEEPTRRLEGLRFGRGKPLAASHDDESDEESDDVVAVAPTPKVGRPRTRPPLAKRRVTSVAGGTLTSTPIEVPPTVAVGVCPAMGCERPGASWRASLAPALRPFCLSHRALAHRAVRVEGLDADAAAAKVLAGATRRRSEPVASEPAPAPVEASESAELQLARARAEEAEAKVARLQRLLNQVTVERDAHRDRADVDAHHLEQLRGEVEGLTTDLGVARRDLAATVQQLNELSDRTRGELAQLATERDEARVEKLEALGAEAYAWDLVDLAMTTGLAAVTEARAETATVLRQSGELSRQVGALREELDAQRAAPLVTTVDELMLERIAQRAARKAVALQGDAAKLARLAQEHGGADALVRLVEGALALRKAVG